MAASGEREGCAAGECGINGGGSADGDARRANVTLPERVEAAAKLLLLNNCAGT